MSASDSETDSEFKVAWLSDHQDGNEQGRKAKRARRVSDEDVNSNVPEQQPQAVNVTVDTWWKVNLAHRPRLTRGATPLVERCIRTYGWNLGFCENVLAGYRKFLTWKQTFEDWDATKFLRLFPLIKCGISIS